MNSKYRLMIRIKNLNSLEEAIKFLHVEEQFKQYEQHINNKTYFQSNKSSHDKTFDANKNNFLFNQQTYQPRNPFINQFNPTFNQPNYSQRFNNVPFKPFETFKQTSKHFRLPPQNLTLNIPNFNKPPPNHYRLTELSGISYQISNRQAQNPQKTKQFSK